MVTAARGNGLGPVIIDVEGTTLCDEDRQLLIEPMVGGLILFARNIESKPQVMDLINEIRQIRPELLIAVDQEGGRVQRLQSGFTRIPPMQVFWRSCADSVGGNAANVDSILPLVRDCGWLLASEVLACDIDISFAPVLDVDENTCDVIADRSFAPDPSLVITLAAAFMEGMHEAGMATTGKHFPGHGHVQADSHIELPVDPRSYDDVAHSDLRPFVELSKQLDAVMPAHIQFPAVDSLPVGFSEYWLKDILRTQIGFEGVIFSDDLSMAGAASAGSYSDRAQLALEAGCDSILVCNNREGAKEVIGHLNKNKPDAGSRLTLMRKRKSVTWDSLAESTRWQQTRNRLSELVES